MKPQKFKNLAAGRKSGFSRRLLPLLMFFTWMNSALGGVHDVEKCPKVCQCRYVFDIEFGSVLRVMCLEGDMHTIPLRAMEKNVFKLIVKAPPGHENHITIGPIFTQPAPLFELRDIEIINSNVPSIGKNAFWGLKNLKILVLKYNKLTSIEADNFRGLILLTELNLSHNRIADMPSETFVHCPNLGSLSLAHNNITVLLPRLFRMLAKLRVLDLSGNPLTELNPEVFKDIQALNIFKCRSCMLSRINVQIYHLAPMLIELDLGYNQLKYILTDDFPNLKKLRILKLDGNQISVIVDYVFGQNHELSILDLSNNRLALLSPMALTNVTQLSDLNISNNKLDRFHLQTFAPVVRSLKIIDFSGNNLPLNEIAIVLQILTNLDEVGLANLTLPDIPPNFFMYNPHIERLDLSWNKLTEFPLKLLSKTKFLRKLDLSHNYLTALDEPDLQRLEALSDIFLSKNRWHCDQCSAGMMIVYMGTSVLNGTLRSLRCYSPMRLRGSLFSNMSYDTLEPCSTSHEAKMSLIAGLVLVLVAALGAVTGALCCTRRRVHRYYTNEGKRHERNHEHPEELLPHTELGNLATTHVPLDDLGEHS